MTGNDNVIGEIFDRLRSIDWKGEASSLLQKLKKVAIKAGRETARQLLRLYYVLMEGDLTLTERAWVYAALLYIAVPGDLLPRKVFHLIGIMDDAAALYYVVKKVKAKLTPAIEQKVDMKLDEWFGYEISVAE